MYAIRLMFVSFDANVCRSICHYRFNSYMYEFNVNVRGSIDVLTVPLIFVQVRFICIRFDLRPHGLTEIRVMSI